MNPSALQQAALLLHVLPPEDQDWVLGHLEAGRRECLVEMAGELKALGIPPDASFLQQLTNGVARAEGTDECSSAVAECVRPALSPHDAMVKALESVPAARMATALRGEPVALIAALLAIRNWPWSKTLMDHLDAEKRRRVNDRFQRNSRYSERLAQAIVAAVSQQISMLERHSSHDWTDQPAEGRPSASPRRWIASFLRRLRRMADDEAAAS